MAGDIYDLVNKATQSQSNTKASKVQLGYTVDTYKGVLAELQKYQSALAQAASGGAEMGAGGVTSTRRPIFARWTMLGSINVLDVNSVDADQFIVDSDGDRTKFRQRKCVLKPFMSFCVNITDTEGKELGYFAGFDSHNETLNGGISASSTGKLTYPLTNMTDKTCDTVGSALGNMGNPFEIGIGVDFEKNADVFFSACFPSIYKAGMSGKLVAKKALLAEVSFVNGTKAQTLHARVIANASSPDGLLQSIYFPVPLLLLSDYKTLGKVGVNDGEVKIVGQDCTFPFANSKFDHLEAKIDDFTPQSLKDILSKHRTVSQATAIFDTTKWQDQKSVEYDLCYVRFYLDKTKEAEIKEVLGDLPNDAELYKGVDVAKQGEKVIGWEDSVSAMAAAVGLGSAALGLKDDSAFYAQGQVDWVKFRQKHPNLPEGHERIIEMVAEMYNINTRMWMTQMGLETAWFKSKNFRQRKNPGGISAGAKYKSGQSYTLSYLGGVTATKETSVRGEGYGHYWIFDSYEDGYRAMAHLLVNSSRYGLGKFGAKTVYEHFTNMFRGGYCDLREAVCQNYNDKLMNQYARVY